MKINHKKQQGATLITWLIAAGFAVMIASAVVKIVPYYVEFNSVKGLMANIAGEPGMKKANMRQLNAKIEKYLNVNALYAIEQQYYNSKPGSRVKNKPKNPFSLSRDKKRGKRILTVHYKVPQPWIGNLSFLIDFKHAVVLGYPDEKVEFKHDIKGRDVPKINLN